MFPALAVAKVKANNAKTAFMIFDVSLKSNSTRMMVVKKNGNLKYISIATDMNEHNLSIQVPSYSCWSIAVFAQVFDVFDQELLNEVIEAVFVPEVQVMLVIWNF